MLWKKIDKKDYTLYKNTIIDLQARVYEMQDVNKVYINYKGCNLIVPMMIWEFETDLRFACLDDVKVKGIVEEGERYAYFTVNKDHTDSLLEEVYFFLTDHDMDCVLDDFLRVDWEENSREETSKVEEDDSQKRIGTHVIYKGKDYQGGIDEHGAVYIATYNEEDADDSFQYIRFSGRYVKDLDIEKEVSAFYEIIEMCDYMGETFLPMGSTEDVIGLFASDSKYLEKGFVPDGRDGYIKEVKRSEVTTRLVLEDRLLYYKLWKLIKERIKDDPSISKFSIGVFNRGFFDERKGCFFWDGNYYIYSIAGGLDIIGPFDGKDVVYACAKILGKESLFDDFKFSEIAEKTYNNNVFHSIEEMKKYAYTLPRIKKDPIYNDDEVFERAEKQGQKKVETKYYKFDIGGGGMRVTGNKYEYLNLNGDWVEDRTLIRKFIGGDTDYDEISKEEAEILVRNRKNKNTL